MFKAGGVGFPAVYSGVHAGSNSVIDCDMGLFL